MNPSRIQKNAEENPRGARDGQARILMMAEMLIMVRRKTPSTLAGDVFPGELGEAFGAESPSTRVDRFILTER